ncbi:hypothetical protein BGX28_008097 [Mortierella sp. GBA30]|nr:hypothetical protein BGX28_008097 [Mortierella sp. GBA30]
MDCLAAGPKDSIEVPQTLPAGVSQCHNPGFMTDPSLFIDDIDVVHPMLSDFINSKMEINYLEYDVRMRTKPIPALADECLVNDLQVIGVLTPEKLLTFSDHDVLGYDVVFNLPDLRICGSPFFVPLSLFE